MRRIGLLCLLASASLADPLTEVASTQFVGSQVDIVAIAVGGDYLPSILSQRVQGSGHWRSVSLGLANVDQGKLDGPALGMERLGGGIAYVWLEAGEFRVLELAYDGRKTKPTDRGAMTVANLSNPRLLSIAALRDGPRLVVAHDGGISIGAVAPRVRGRVDVIRTGGDAVAATEPMIPVRDTVIFVVAPGRLLELVQDGDAFKLGSEQRLQPDGFVPHAIAGAGRELWIAGELRGRATLLRLDARTPAGAPALIDLGKGVVEKVRVLGPREIAVAGTKDGRAWVGVVGMGPRPDVAYEAFLKGNAVTVLGVNPARRGWSLAAATPDGTVSLLRLPRDEALPGDWDPFVVPPPPQAPENPAPAPAPAPGPGPVVEREEELPPVEAGPRGSAAILPRAEVQRAGGVDTEIVLINLGRQPMQVFLRFVPDEGRGSFTRLVLEPGKRAKVSLAEKIVARRGFGREVPRDFDGYVRIDGGSKDDLVIDAVIRRAGQPPEDVRPHWR